MSAARPTASSRTSIAFAAESPQRRSHSADRRPSARAQPAATGGEQHAAPAEPPHHGVVHRRPGTADRRHRWPSRSVPVHRNRSSKGTGVSPSGMSLIALLLWRRRKGRARRRPSTAPPRSVQACGLRARRRATPPGLRRSADRSTAAGLRRPPSQPGPDPRELLVTEAQPPSPTRPPPARAGAGAGAQG